MAHLLPHLSFPRPHKREESRRSRKSRAPHRSTPVPAMGDIRFAFCHFAEEVLVRSLPHHPDSHVPPLHPFTSKKQPPPQVLPRATRTTVGPPFGIMVRRFLRPNFKVSFRSRRDITVRRVAPGHKDNQERKRKAEGQVSASRVGRSRTDPYQAPYFFPSPMSPGASDYVEQAQHNRKPVLSDHAHTPMPTEGQQNARSSSQFRGRLRSVWPPLHRRSSSHS
jgi:hypothetical protein